ncbi:hemicentin-1 [Misgurnus anguillicaudatus]|uniref:hemicentin-1 n=1 Tax=Misgurnus anguillicaudatus TaxID=75329 RepID=UPI003CCF9673
MGLVPMMLLSQQLLGVLLITLAHGGLEVGADGSHTTPDVTSETLTVFKLETDGPTPEVTSEPVNITVSKQELVTNGSQPTPEVTSEPLNITVSNCPIFFSPPAVVVEYGEPVSVNCLTNITHESLSWERFETEEETTENGWSSLTLNETADWYTQPSCAIVYDETQCSKNLSLTVYKTPDSVSISTVDNKIIEGIKYELQCDIVNVAPVESLIVKWFKEETELHNETFTDTIKTPVNVTSKLQITANRSDDGAQYRCEAELELGADGPQPPPIVTSEPLNIPISSLSSLLQLIPPRVVVEYSRSVSVNCSTDVTHDGIGWNASDGSVPETRDKLITWEVSNLRRWDIRPKCYINYKTKTHETELPVTVYKTPDSVSISTVDNKMIEGFQYELQCDIVNVAPVKSLIVKWFKEETELHNETFYDTIKTPVNKTSKLQITANRSDDGVQYRCEAELELGADGPQPPPIVTSEPLNITVSSLSNLLQLIPPRVVVEYGSSVSVNCSTDVTHDGIGWNASDGSVPETRDKLITWKVSNLRRWDIRPKCYINYKTTKNETELPVTVYIFFHKTPDSVSINTVNHRGPMIEGSWYELQCDIVNVAPVKSLIVKWFKRETKVKTETFNDTTKTPVNVRSTLQFTSDKDNDGAQYRCEAELNLGIDGQPPPNVTSEPLSISVYSFCDFLQFSPPSVVVEYGSSVSVNCSTDVTHNGIGWKAPEGSVPMTTDKLITWKVSNLRRWNVQPICYISTNWTKCVSLLPVLIYKTPDSVSINKVDYKIIEGLQYELQCDIVNVAPVKNLIVKWFKGEIEVKVETFTDNIKTPVNKTSKLQITANRSDDGVQYKCEAELKLGEEGPQPPPKVTSEPLRITVHDICALLEFKPPSVVVRCGSSVSVDCSTDVTHDGIGWEAPVGSVPLTADKRVTWRVSNLRRWDIRPQCYINYNRQQCSILLPVTVYKTPDSVIINTVNHTGPMTEGSKYELQCDIVNVAPVKSLIVKWFKAKTEVHSETFNDTIKTPVNRTSKLQITVDRDDDGAQYRCEAELELGADGPQPPPKVTSEPLNITVHYKPQIRSCKDWAPKTGSFLSSYPSRLYSVVGNPQPNISWRLRSSSINNHTILNKNYSGRYTMIASNTYGASSCEINITVEYPPTLNCSKQFYQIKENEPFPCLADGLPKSVISVYKADGKVIQFPFTPRWNDSGLYNVTASNKHGHAYHQFNLSILYAPVFDTSEDKFDVEEGSSITLKCIFFGNPEPNMWWTFKNQNITTGGRNNAINITKATSVDAGVYTCSATNQLGRKDKIFTVEIKEKSLIYIYVLVIVFVLLLMILLIWLWKKRKAQGSYQVQTEQEMMPLTNGKSK